MGIKKSLFVPIVCVGFLLLYLVVAYVWASISVPELVDEEVLDKIEITEEQKKILLAVEDPRFYDHIGVDISQGQGLTTITSSLAKDIFLQGKGLGNL